MINHDAAGYFITGSDTDVGKTYIACQLLRQLRALEIDVETRKPAESGCQPGPDGELLTRDAAALREANGNIEKLDKVVAFRLRAALAPHRAARLEGRSIYLQDLVDACARSNPDSLLLVEGAGGFYSPLAENGLNADLASHLQLPVIIVVDDRIGAVNQALMTIQAVESRQLPVAAVVLNEAGLGHAAGMDNAADLGDHCGYPIIRCANGAELPRVFG